MAKASFAPLLPNELFPENKSIFLTELLNKYTQSREKELRDAGENERYNLKKDLIEYSNSRKEEFKNLDEKGKTNFLRRILYEYTVSKEKNFLYNYDENSYFNLGIYSKNKKRSC